MNLAYITSTLYIISEKCTPALSKLPSYASTLLSQNTFRYIYITLHYITLHLNKEFLSRSLVYLWWGGLNANLWKMIEGIFIWTSLKSILEKKMIVYYLEVSNIFSHSSDEPEYRFWGLTLFLQDVFRIMEIVQIIPVSD